MMTPAKKAAAKPKPYHWFQGASVRQLYDELTEYGPDAARLEVRVEGKQMFFRVCAEDGVGSDPIDNSHICPPQCPG